MKKLCKSLFILMLFFTCSLNIKVNAYTNSTNDTVILGGNSIGLKLDTGVYVAGKYQVQTENQKMSPWKNSDIKEGDKIIAYNNIKINSNSELLNLLKDDHNDTVSLTINRNNYVFDTSIDIVKTKNDSKSLGLYIKDKMVGIGTLTFINPKSNIYGSLAHGIYENNTIISTTGGDITVSTVEGIKKSTPGSAGEKRASIGNSILGSIVANKITGVYGKITTTKFQNYQKIKVASQDKVKMGRALMYTVIDGEKVEAFEIKITNISLQSSPDIKGLKFEVTDSRLLNLTGGIVQGMSGSPIVQNGELIGAVSHVCIDKPSTGYGIHIEWMLNDASY